jgi:23S rRNA pseudouridine1911/1915/1917 synthase
VSQEDEVELFVEEPGERLDRWLTFRLLDLTRSRIQKLIDSKMVVVNGSDTTSNYRVRAGDQINISIVSENQLELRPQPLKLDILYEDEDLLVINKEAGLTVHPGAGTFGTTTLVEGVLYYLKQSPKPDQLRPGIVHRLDKDTTGALVVSKNEFAHHKLSLQFSEKTNHREYAALLVGVLPQAELSVESYLSRDPHHRLKFVSNPTDPGGSARWAKTVFREQARFAHRMSLASVTLHTGRTHQIRVHAKVLNASVLGDPLYGHKVDFGGHMTKEVQAALNKASRQMLHARLLGFTHPRTGVQMMFEAPVPEDFKSLLNLLKPYAFLE